MNDQPHHSTGHDAMTFDAKDRETAILFLTAIVLFLLLTHFFGG